jgi:hypothetical protein
MGTNDKGQKIAIGLADSGQTTPTGDKIYTLAVDTSITLNNATIGAVEIQDAASADQAKVAVGSTIVSTDNALAVRDANPIPAGTNTMGGVTYAGKAAAYAPSLGIAGAAFSSANASAAPAAVISAPGGGLKAVITDLIVSIAPTAALTVTFTEETSGTVLLVLNLPLNSSPVILKPDKWKLPTATKRLMVQTSGAGQINVTAWTYTEA